MIEQPTQLEFVRVERHSRAERESKSVNLKADSHADESLVLVAFQSA